VDRDAAKKATFCKQKINKSGENFFLTWNLSNFLPPWIWGLSATSFRIL